MKINWRERFIAAAVHFVVTLLIAGIAAAVIFLVWFPSGLASLVGGTALFLIVVASDLILGPLMSLVIYSSAKPLRTLIVDYSLVGVVQLAALVYGMLVVADSRPVFVAFAVDRLEVVTAIELDANDLAHGIEPAYRSKSWTGPRLVTISSPTDAEDRQNRILSAAQGKDVQLVPKYYRAYLPEQALVFSRSIAVLNEGSGAAQPQIDKAVASLGGNEAALRWLLVRHRFGFATVFIDATTGEPIKYVTLDPTWVKSDPLSSRPRE